MARARQRRARGERAGPTRLTLAPSLRIAAAQALRDQLGEALAAGRPVVLEAAAVEATDTAALQLLCAFVREGRERGIAVEWQAPAPALTRDAGLLGVAALLGLPEPTAVAAEALAE
ncbi:MAG: STAS domain-containing protein [Mizugakiibacter sp.]|uniref:STAS domain-containing protein n=1 Tax=Mizugakiibacter sp. TaxID=1972610 RepID=UPI0031BF6652|nr:STAS domain-containing protein [Xanthomonadaceae bacterium]